MFVRRLMVPLALWIMVVLYLAFVEERQGVMIWVIPPALLLMVVYIFTHQLNYWYVQRYRPTLDDPLRQFVHRLIPWVIRLEPEVQQRLEERLVEHMEGADYTGMALDTIPEEAKAAVSLAAVIISWQQEKVMLSPFERVVFYKHPFPSPNYQFLHASETDFTDHVQIYSLEQLMAAWLRPDRFINVAYYEWGRVFQYLFDHKSYPASSPERWHALTRISSQSLDQWKKFTGFEELDFWGVATACFFCFPQRMLETEPTLFQNIREIYGLPLSRLQNSST